MNLNTCSVTGSGKHLIMAFAILGFCLSATTVQAEQVSRTVFVHLFEWRWDDIAKECETFLGPRGFAAVQVSPPNEHRLVPGYPWWERYQPVSYQLVSRSGNRQQFEDMVKRCKTAGVKIYVDAVINHMTGPSEANDFLFGKGIAGSDYIYYAYPPYPNQTFFHSCHDEILPSDYGNRWKVQNCDLAKLADLDTGSAQVQNTIAAYLNDLAGVGVAGFRIDAAKHIPKEICQRFGFSVFRFAQSIGKDNFLVVGEITDNLMSMNYLEDAKVLRRGPVLDPNLRFAAAGNPVSSAANATFQPSPA